MQQKQRPRLLYPKIGTLDFGAMKKKPTLAPRPLPQLATRPATKAEKRLADRIVNDMLNDVRKLNTPSRINKYGTKEMEDIIGQLRRMELDKMKNMEKQPIPPLCPRPRNLGPHEPKNVVKNINDMTLAELRQMYAAEAKATKKKTSKVAKLKEKVKKDMKKLRAVNEPNMKVDRSRALGQLKTKTRKQMKVLNPENAPPQIIQAVQKNINEANKQIELIRQILQKNKEIKRDLKRPLRRLQRMQVPSPKSVGSMGSSVGSGRSSRSVSPAGSMRSMYSDGSRASVHSTPGRSPASPVGLFHKKSPNAMEMLRVDDPKMYLKKLGYNNTRIARKSKKVENPYRTDNLMKIADALKIKRAVKITNTELRKKIRAKIN